MVRRKRSERRLGRLVAVSDALERGLAPTARKHGFSDTRLLLRWESVVGTEIAAWTRPLRLFRGVLHLRVASAWAPYIQHLAPAIRDRVNLFLGRKAVTRIVLKQGRIDPTPPPGPAIAPLPEPIPVSGISDPELRMTLARLGGAVQARQKRIAASGKPASQGFEDTNF
ncbi:MAG: DUF721 domain-containing protein [Alphaproteobacteria bacterium]|nr:DUF721 domain-containing protein [Alphaproteobacteria bacterium]MCY4318896.1 DUF721 domain-containing protein [Alphaproteobacteria bacterium]